MEYAIWGAWMPVLAARLLGPLKMTGKQTGWIYATLPLACIFMPLISGQLADKYVNTEIILAVAHLAGAVLMFIAVKKTTFKSLFIVMFLYCLCFAATLPLVNSLMFSHLAKNNLDPKIHSKWIFFWAPVAWALIGYGLTGWRWKFKTGEQGRDCLYLAAILSVIMCIGCFFMPDTPPAEADTVPLQATDTQIAETDTLPGFQTVDPPPAEEDTSPVLQAMSMLKESNFLIFIIVSMIFFGLMQFYFLGTAQFMQDMGIPAKNVPASMAIAQGVQAIATVLLMALLLDKLGAKWTLVIGAIFWLLLYIVYINGKPRWLIVGSQSFHGLAYVLFVIVGQIFAESVSKPEIIASVQSLLFAATTGVGLFLGTQFAGLIMDKFRKEEKFQWRQIFMVPGAIALVSILVLLLFFKG